MTRVLKRSFWAGAGMLIFSSMAFGQVFTQDPGANVGITSQGTGQKLYGSFGLNSATDPEYKIYRKLLEVTSEPLSSATNVEGNPGEVHWIDVNQRQGAAEGLPKRVLTAPGMFIGQKNHTTEEGWVVSNPNEILYFKPLIDQFEDQAAITDTNRNANWDVRFGFMESPEDFVDFVEPNSEQLDLWTGRFDTDAVYGQLNINRDNTDDPDNPPNVRTAMGHGGSFKLQSGDPDTAIANEGGRANVEMFRTVAGTGAELERTGLVDAGVAYTDPIEVTWGLKPSEDAGFVDFWIKTGNIISTGQFEPGTADTEPFELPNDEFYTDDFFDWTKAKPVFFAGAQGLTGSEGNMGIFIPGDFGADGSVNLDDFNRLARDYGGQGTTYSRGDLTQDGITNMDDAAAWAELASAAVKSEALAAVQGDLGGTAYDFDGNGSTGDEDVSFISGLLNVTDVCVNSQGDIDGNGKVEFADFLVLSGNFGKEADAAGGDIDCNGKVEFADFLVLSGNFGKTVGGAAAVPEPSGMALLSIAAIALSLVRRRR